MINVKPQRNINTVFLFSSLEKIIAQRAGLSDGKGKIIRWLLLEGSSRSSKTWAIISFLICCALDPEVFGKKSLIVRAYRNDATTCRDTIVADFLTIMSGVFGGEGKDGRWVSMFESAGRWNKTTLCYTFNNGSTFSFHGASDPQKLQGLKAHVSWFNEAMEISFDAKTQIEMRTELFNLADWNPSETDHWIFDSIMTLWGEFAYQHTTYKDNYDLDTGKSNLEPAVIAAIEALEPTPENIARGTADRFKWMVYGEGRRGVRENLVFPRYCWEVIDDDKFPLERACQRHGYGEDFGYSQDPTALIKCALHNDAIYLHQCVYKRGLLIGRSYDNPDIPSLVGMMDALEIDKTEPISADCAAPEAIAQQRAAGYNARGTGKGAESINYGLQLMRQHRIYVTRSSQQLIKEFEN